MSRLFLIGTLATALAVSDMSAALAMPAARSAATANSTASEAPAPVSENWTAAGPALPSPFDIRVALRDAAAEEEELAEAARTGRPGVNRYRGGTEPGRAKYERFATRFEAAKIPGCFKQDGLKYQPTFIFAGLLALPFIPIAALRGKCN